MLVVLAILVAIFCLWWSIAYLYAYIQTRERLLLLQVGQGMAFTLMFTYISFAGINQLPLSGILLGLLILLAMAASVIWRVRGGIKWLVQRYPRGMLDVLLLRKPAVDFKRRVRGK